MSISSEQQAILLKGLNGTRVAKRKGGGGMQLSYLEAWDVKAHLIRVFGFTNFSADVLSADLMFEEPPADGKRNWEVGYKVVLRLTIRPHGADEATYTEAAVGFASLPSRGECHDMAIKTAESDALKRAAVYLGDQFGLSLYNNGSIAPVVQITVVGPDGSTSPVKAPQGAVQPEPVPDAEGVSSDVLEALQALSEEGDAEQRILGIAGFKTANEHLLTKKIHVGGKTITVARHCDLIAAGAYLQHEQEDTDAPQN